MLDGETLEFEAGDDRNLSELLQHEIDHLDGILAIDRVIDLKTICTREEFEKRYRAASPYATRSSYNQGLKVRGWEAFCPDSMTRPKPD